MGREGGGAPGHRRGEDAGTAAPALPPQHAASHRPAPAPTGWATAGGTRGEGRKAGRAAAQPPRRGVPAPAPPCCPRLGVAVAQETGAGPGQLAGRGAPPPGTRPVACSLTGPAPSWVPGVLTSVLRYGLRGRPWMALPLRRLPVCSTVTAAVAQEQGGGGPVVADALRVAQYCPWGWRQARLRWAAFTAPCPGCSLRFARVPSGMLPRKEPAWGAICQPNSSIWSSRFSAACPASQSQRRGWTARFTQQTLQMAFVRKAQARKDMAYLKTASWSPWEQSARRRQRSEVLLRLEGCATSGPMPTFAFTIQWPLPQSLCGETLWGNVLGISHTMNQCFRGHFNLDHIIFLIQIVPVTTVSVVWITITRIASCSYPCSYRNNIPMFSASWKPCLT